MRSGAGGNVLCKFQIVVKNIKAFKNIEVRRLYKNHLGLIINIGINDPAFQCVEEEDIWSREELFKWLLCETDVCVGCFLGQELIGYCLTHYHIAANKVHIENIYINPQFRRNGLGSKLVSHIKKEYELMSLNSRKLRYVALTKQSNTVALKFLTKIGFCIGETMLWAQG